MDQSRSPPSYSDDFEQDIDSPQNSPRSEEKVEIKVFKTAVGSLTVHPKKIFRNGTPMKKALPLKNKAGRTLSEISILAHKCNKSPPDSGQSLMSGGGRNERSGSRGNSKTQPRAKSNTSIQANDSRSSLGNRPSLMRNRALAQEKIDPHDLPASEAPSAASLNLPRNHSGGTSAIRRVQAHTAIKEKSYASAKYKTYQNPAIVKGNYGKQPRGGYVSQRVASAKRMTIMDLKSKIKLLEDEIEKLRKDNRFLNHLHHRQDTALRKWEGKDAELPRLLNQHKDEIRSLHQQLRRAQQNSRDLNEKLSARDKKIIRLETELKKLRTLAQEEQLLDRHTLQEELEITRVNLAGAEKRIREYMRHIEILEKNHKNQLAAQEKKLIKVNAQIYELQQVVANLKTRGYNPSYYANLGNWK